MNVQTGKDENNKFCLHNSSNRNEKYQADFSLENRLACLDIKFQIREGKVCTDAYLNNIKAQLNHILINKKWINSTVNCETYCCFEGISSDHRIIAAKIRLSLHGYKKQMV